MDKMTKNDEFAIGKTHLKIAMDLVASRPASATTFMHARIACQKLYAAKVMGLKGVDDLLEKAEDLLDECVGAQAEPSADAQIHGEEFIAAYLFEHGVDEEKAQEESREIFAGILRILKQ